MEQFQDLSVNIGHGNPFPPWRQGLCICAVKLYHKDPFLCNFDIIVIGEPHESIGNTCRYS